MTAPTVTPSWRVDHLIMPTIPPKVPPRLSDAARKKLRAQRQAQSPGEYTPAPDRPGTGSSAQPAQLDVLSGQHLAKDSVLSGSGRHAMEAALCQLMVRGGPSGPARALSYWAQVNSAMFAQAPLAHPAYSSAIAADHYLHHLVSQTAQVRANQVKQHHINAQKIPFDGGGGLALSTYVTSCHDVVRDFISLTRSELGLSSDLCGNISQISLHLAPAQMAELTCSPAVLQALHRQKVAHRKMSRHIEAAVFAAQQAMFDLGRQKPNKDGSVWVVDLFSVEPRHIQIKEQTQFDRLTGLYEQWTQCLQRLRMHDLPGVQRKIEQAVVLVAQWGRPTA